MKKRIFAALSAMLMLLALAGCGAKQMDYDATCTISISCATILDNMDACDPDKREQVPQDGVILAPVEVGFQTGENVFDVLQRVCRENRIQMESKWTPLYGSAYIQGIHNLYEFDVGSGSGWMYCLKNVFPNVGFADSYLSEGDVVRVQFTLAYGSDIGGGHAMGTGGSAGYYEVANKDALTRRVAAINAEIERLRHSATSSLFERRDVIVVASVSCIYGLGDPIDYKNMVISLRPGQTRNFDELLRKLIEIRYERNDIAFERNMFRVRGDTVEIFPAYATDKAIRVEFFGDEVDRISEVNVVTGAPVRYLNHAAIYPASHYVTTKEKMDRALGQIREELEDQVKYFNDNEMLVEAQRIRQRTEYDMEMMRELGYCSGIENYSRIISDRPAGSAPMTLLDFFPDDFLLFVDESHVTLPQVRAMYNGDRARKESLVRYGFRLPCAFDNRPLKFEEFESRIGQAVFVSATPGPYERERADNIVEQVIRPTGLLDPRVEVRPVEGQIDDLMEEIRARAKRNERVLVTTLTKKMAEDLTEFFRANSIRVRYMHADVATIERMEIIRDLRLGEFDVLVGINLLREGLDLPEVSLVAVLDADKEGFLRSETSLIQTIGRAARNAEGLVILYADTVTPSMRAAMDETERRRKIQDAYNKAHGIVPKTIIKDVREILEISKSEDSGRKAKGKPKKLTDAERTAEIAKLEQEMKEASKLLEFEYAAVLRDRIIELKGGK